MSIPQAAIHRFTFEDFQRMAEAGVLPDMGFELVDGLVVEMSPKGDRHWFAVTALGELFSDQRAGRYVVSAESLTLRLGPNDSRDPDLVLSRGTLSGARERPRPEDVALVVEVADSSVQYDLSEKKMAYAMAGIPEYWVVDVVSETVHVFREANRFGGRYLKESSHERAAAISPREYPDVVIPVARLFGLT